MKKFIVLLFFLFFNSQLLNAQECGFQPPENYETYDYIQQNKLSNEISNVPENYCINVSFWIARNDDGSNPAFNAANIPLQLSKMNNRFNPHGISFYQIGAINYVNNSNLNNALAPSGLSYTPNCLNIIFVKTVYAPNPATIGLADYNNTRLRVDGDAISPTSETLNHEVGHCLNLLHTFHCTSPLNSSCIQSPYNNDSCLSLGDQICDTPADYDPNQTQWPFPASAYNPDLTNIMAYRTSRDHFTIGQGDRMKNSIIAATILQRIRSYQCAQISGTDRVCPYVSDGTLNTTVPIYDFSIPIYGSGNTFTWSILGNSNLQFVGSNTSSSVQITNTNQSKYLYSAIIQVIVNTPNGSVTITKNVSTTCFIRRVIGLYDWLSVDYGNMGLIVPIDNQNTFTSYEREITEDENRATLNNDKTKPQFIGSDLNSAFKFTSATNQAVVNWGNASSSYLITCYGVRSNGTKALLNNSYVDVGDPKNNPCFKDTITTIVAPNPIQNGIINVVLNKPSHTTPCNYKDLDEPQYFNSEIDEINNSVSVFDFNGTEIYRNVFDTNEFTIESVHLQSGNNYIVNLYTKEGGFTQQVIIVE